MSFKLNTTLALASALTLVACGGSETEEKIETPVVVAETPQEAPGLVEPAKDPNRVDFDGLLNLESRPDKDKEHDAARRPAEILKFINPKLGWVILELKAGSGYYTELFSHAVGPNGRVYMHNPAGVEDHFKDALDERFADGRLPNVRRLTSDFDEIPLNKRTAHIVTWIMGPHDLFHHPEEGSEHHHDPAAAFQKVYEVMRPNARLLIIDHAASADTPETSGEELHRIDPAIIIDLAAEAGFVVDKTSDILSNPDDDYSKSAADETVRNKTDRFIISFKKAEKEE